MVPHVGEKRGRLLFGAPKRGSASVQRHRDLYVLPSTAGSDLLPAALCDVCARF